MKTLVLKLRRFFNFIIPNAGLQLDPSAQALATLNSLNRRKNTRIKYSHIGAIGDMPKIIYLGEDMGVGNISVGGLLIVDDLDKMGFEVGTVIQLELVWPDLTCKLNARIVGAQLARRHVQFLDFEPEPFVRISRLIQPGFIGGKFHRVIDLNNMLDASEFWVGPTGENIQFPREASNGIYAKIALEKRLLVIPHVARPYWEENGEPVDRELLSYLLVLLSNLPETTGRILSLIEHLNEHYTLTPKRGTGKSVVA